MNRPKIKGNIKTTIATPTESSSEITDMSLNDIVQYLDGLDHSRYSEKLAKLNIHDPYSMPREYFVELSECSAEELPEFSYHDLYNYLVNSESAYTGQSLKSYKTLDAYKSYVAGCVIDMVARQINESLFLIFAEVASEQDLSTSHRPWVAVNVSGAVMETHCSCMNGTQVCSHVASALFALDAIICTQNTGSASAIVYPKPSKFMGASKGVLGSELDFSTQRRKSLKEGAVEEGSDAYQKPGSIQRPTPHECNTLIEDLRKTGVQCAVLFSVSDPQTDTV